jgi:ABC-type antimicrobial peptide transport system permease subunit
MTLSAIGLYGILAYFVTGRSREIGLRMALGAESSHVIWLVTKQLVPTMAAGLLGGVILSFLAVTWVRSLLYGMQPFDPRSMSAAVLLMTATGIAAAVAPTFLAMRVDPAYTLRQE